MSDLETRARALLQAAGETVPVGPAAPLPEPRRSWPILAAVAAIVVTVVGLSVVLRGNSDSAGPTVPSGDVIVPQTLMMTVAQATQVLEEHGLQVRLVSAVDGAIALECGIPFGRVLGSEPPPHSAVEAGTRVDLGTAGSSIAQGFCAGPPRMEDALALLDLARFSTPDPDFAESVQIWVDGELARTLSADDAREPSHWGNPSPLSRMLAALNDVRPVNGRPASPRVWSMVDTGDQYACGPNDPPEPLSAQQSTVVTIGHLDDYPGVLPVDCHWVRVYRNEEGRIYAVASADQPWPADERPTPSETPPTEPTADQRAIAEAFLDFANGGAAPAFAGRVQLLLGNVPVTTVDGTDAARASTWVLPCDGYAERSCPIDALSYVVRRGTVVHETILREGSACHAVGELPEELSTRESLERSVSLGIAEPRMCMDNWEVQLWLDDDLAIRAVNLILGSP